MTLRSESSCRFCRMLLAVVFVVGASMHLNAQLVPVGTFEPPVSSIEGMAFDPTTGNLWMVEQGGNTLFEVDTSGALISSVVPAITPIEGLHVLPNGNLLVVHNSGTVQELTPDGAIAPNGISLSIGLEVNDPEGVTFDPGSNSVIVSAEGDRAIFEFDLNGALINTFDVAPDRAQGITIDLFSEKLFYVFDADNKMVEITRSGDFVREFDLATAFPDFNQPDAITMDPLTQTYYAGSDSDGQVIAFRIAVVPHDVVVPNSFSVTRGEYLSGGLADLAGSNDMDLSIRRATADIQSRTEFEVTAVSPTPSPSSLEVTLEGSVFARSDVNQTIELYDYSADSWEQIDTRPATRFTDSTVTVAATGDLSRFIESGIGQMSHIRARVRYQSTNPRQRFASNTDQFIWTIGQ